VRRVRGIVSRALDSLNPLLEVVELGTLLLTSRNRDHERESNARHGKTDATPRVEVAIDESTDRDVYMRPGSGLDVILISALAK
jgi:hypothetical protein